MSMKIPSKFNKMAVYRQPSESKLTGWIWLMDFSNGFVLPNTGVTGEVGVNATNEYVIQTDQLMGTYLQCTKSGNTSFDDSVHWPDSQTYLNNIFTDGYEPFAVSFWMRAPLWNSYGLQIPICWKSDDGGTGLVCYRDGGNADKIDARLAFQHNFFTDTDAQNQDWVHWVFVREADGTRKWYRNGVLDATDSVSWEESSYLVTATRDITIGWCGAWSCNAVFDVTKYRIYSGVLTAEEIADLYTNKE